MKAKIWNFNKWIRCCDEEILEKLFDDALKYSGFKIIGQLSYKFNPHGFTKVYMLAESHFALHTFPEENKTYIELSSCNKEYFDKFAKRIKAEL